MYVIKFSFLCLLFSFVGKAQDTIIFKAKQKLVVIVKEVSPAEVHYKKIELPDGPMYVVAKNEIDKIVYKNGYTDVFKPAPEEPKAGQEFVVYHGAEDNLNHDKITYNDTKGRYYRLVNLVDRHPDVKRRDNLKVDLKTLRNLKRHQGGTRTLAIIFGGVAVAGLGVYSMMSAAASYGGYVDPVFAMQPMVFGALGLGLGAGSIALTVKLKQKRKDFVNSYNE